MRAQGSRLPGLYGGRKDGPAALAGIHDRIVRGGVQAVMQQVCRAVRQQCISLHFTETDASAKFAAFDWLVSQCIDWPRRPHLQRQGMAIFKVLDILLQHQATRCQSKGLVFIREQ